MLNILNSKDNLVDDVVQIDINQEIVEAVHFMKTGDTSEFVVQGLRKKV